MLQFILFNFRGAELIEELSQKRIEEQQETEKKILEKIKNKMDRIKASQKKLQGPNYREPANHFQGKNHINLFIFEFYSLIPHTSFIAHKIFSLSHLQNQKRFFLLKNRINNCCFILCIFCFFTSFYKHSGIHLACYLSYV